MLALELLRRTISVSFWKWSRLVFIYYPALLPSHFLSAVPWLALPGSHHLLAKCILKDTSWLGCPCRVDNLSLLCRSWSSSSVAWSLTSRTGTSSRTASCRALLYGLRGRGRANVFCLPLQSEPVSGCAIEQSAGKAPADAHQGRMAGVHCCLTAGSLVFSHRIYCLPSAHIGFHGILWQELNPVKTNWQGWWNFFLRFLFSRRYSLTTDFYVSSVVESELVQS